MIAPFLRHGKPVPAVGEVRDVMDEVTKLDGKKKVDGQRGSSEVEEEDGSDGGQSKKKRRASEYAGRGEKQNANQEIEQAFMKAWTSSAWVVKYKTYE